MQLEDFQRLIRALDYQEIEGARGAVSAKHVVPLCSWYFELDDWEQRCALIDLLVDQDDPALDAVCKDVLRAPGSGDSVELPKAFALGWLSGNRELFMTYYNDRVALQRAVDLKLEALGFDPVERLTEVEVVLPPLPESLDDGLWVAATGGRLPDLEQLLQRGANPNLTRDGEPVLLAALIAGYVGCALVLVRKGVDPNARRAIGQQSALWWAATKGSVELVDALLERGAEIDATDRWGATALQQACSHGHEQVARSLLGKGASVHQRYHDGRSILSMSVRGGKAKVLELLLDAGADLHSPQPTFTPLAFACFEGTAEMVELLLRKGANPNVAIDYMNYRGTTPLMFAVQAGSVAMVRALLAGGADSSTRDGKQRTAADYATGKNADNLRRLLF